MKTAVSLPDKLFAEADSYARNQAMSRSELYARALAEYLARHRHENLAQRIDEALARIEQTSAEQPGEMGLDSLRKLPW